MTILPYFSAILLLSIAGLRNPLGIQLLWQSALPATAGGLPIGQVSAAVP